MSKFRSISRNWLYSLLVIFSSTTFLVPAAQAGIIGTDQVLNAQQLQDTRNEIKQLMNRTETVKQFQSMGIDIEQAKNRVDSMTDQELAMMADHMKQMPAGGGLLGTAALIFIILLITDILGYTDIFPFVKK